MPRRYSATELGPGYGIVLGGGVGAVLLAATGDVEWLYVTVPLGLVGGAIWGQLRDRRSGTDRPRSESASGVDRRGPG